MSQIESGFLALYQVKNIRSIKGVNSGEFQGNAYKASVQLKSVNVDQVDDEEMGLVERETILVIKVPCEDSQIKEFNNWLRKQQKENKPIMISGSIPRDIGKDSFSVTSQFSASEMMSIKKDK